SSLRRRGPQRQRRNGTSVTPGDRRPCRAGRAVSDRSSADFCSYADAAAAGAEPDFACLTAATDVARTLVAEADSRGSCPGTLDEVGNAICVPFLAAGDPCAPSPPPCRA